MMRICNFIYSFSFAITIVLACSGDPSVSERRPTNRFMKDDMEIVSSRKVSLPGNDLAEHADEQLNLDLVRNITCDPEAESLYLLNRENEIYKLDRQGRLKAKIARSGRGPGEMELPLLLKYRNHKLYVLDYNNNKILVFDKSEHWLQDIALHFGSVFAFEVTSNDEIILPQITPVKGSKDPLFLFIGHDSRVLRKTSSNEYIEADFVKSFPQPLLFLSPDNCIVLALKAEGCFYKFTMDGRFLFKSDICGGQEWEDSIREDIEFNKTYPSVLLRLNDMFFGKNGTIYAAWGGKFKDRNTMALMYDRNGTFIGRVFQTAFFPCDISAYTLANDSTFWIFNDNKYLLAECIVRKIQ
jgi:hypothetical protein